ncbi:hypothetical protein Pfo_014002 [Paulownia fortunei]|nr:hypothetical protein Pfo_014002 [Paulownia fortunei]
MSDAKEVKFSLKVMINKQKTKVLFAEADSDFADVLLSFLTLPLGKIVRVLEKHYGDKAPVIGSLTTLYNGLANLSSVHFWTEYGKQMLLDPRNSLEAECRKLKLNVDDTQPMKYFRCGDRDCKMKRSPYVSMYYDTRKCDCGKSLNKAMGISESKTQAADNGGDGVFSEEGMSFLITDDLQMAPNVPGSIIQTLINLGITGTDGAELRLVTLGFNEIMDLLKLSLLSKTPLTDFIFPRRRRMNCLTGEDPLHQMEKESSSDSEKMIIVKAMVQKSTNKLLFAQAEEDFVDFLFSLLIIPLGGVEYLLGSNTSLKNIHNLYKSIDNVIDDKYLRTPDTKTRLIKPDLPPKYLSKNQIFSLTEQMTPTIYYFESITGPQNCTVEKGSWMCFKDPKGEGSYVKGPGTFIVTDDLTVTPSCMISSLSVLNRLKIPLSDVREMELQIGLEEALSILKASLTSPSALTNGLIKPILKKQQKQEQ